MLQGDNAYLKKKTHNKYGKSFLDNILSNLYCTIFSSVSVKFHSSATAFIELLTSQFKGEKVIKFNFIQLNILADILHQKYIPYFRINVPNQFSPCSLQALSWTSALTFLNLVNTCMTVIKKMYF